MNGPRHRYDTAPPSPQRLCRACTTILQYKSAIAPPQRLRGKDCLFHFIGGGSPINEGRKLRATLDLLHFCFVTEWANKFASRILDDSFFRQISAKTYHCAMAKPTSERRSH